MSRLVEVEVVAATSVHCPMRRRRIISSAEDPTRNTRRIEHDATHRKQRIATTSTRNYRETPDRGHLREHFDLTALRASPRIGSRRAARGTPAAGAIP